MQPRQPQMCRYGDNCNRFAQGTCKFLHPGQGGQGNQGGQGGQGGQDIQQGPRMNPNRPFNRPSGQNYPPGNYPNNNQGNYPPQQQQQTGWGGQHGSQYGKQFNTPTNMPPKTSDEFTSKFCMSYQFNQPCRYQQKGKCSRIHGFDEQGKIRRISFSNQIPPQQPSKLGKFVKDGQTFLILRMGNGISILTYNQQTSQFAIQKNWAFPKPQLNYYYYSQKDNFIYFAAQNPKSTLHEIYVYDMLNDLLLTIDEAHQGHVTDVIHFTPNILLSSSKDGQIRVWNVSGNTVTLDKLSSDNLLKTYATQGKITQILFLDLSVIGGMKVLSAGTNDNRVLFFLGDQFQYNPLTLPENNTLVFKIRYCTINQVTIAFVLAWSSDSSGSSILAVNLGDFSVSTVVSHSTKENTRNNISVIEIIEQKLFISTIQGTVTVYSLPEIKKIGLLLHKNSVNSIVPAQYITKTNIKIPQMFVLESKFSNEKPGSIGVYTVKL